MIRIPRTKRGLLAYLFAIFMLTFSVFETSNAPLPKRIVHAPSPTSIPERSPVLGEKTGETFVVTRVIDGDTIEIDTGQKIRLIGINTPESVDTRSIVECFGKEAAAFTRSRLLNKNVHLMKDVSETDHFGRLLRYVYVGDELFNNTLVEEGYAYATSYPPDVAHQREFQTSERTARFNVKGLWKACPTQKQPH